MTSLAKSFSPALNQQRHWIVSNFNEPAAIFGRLRERYITMKFSDARGASSAETVESSDNDTRTVRVRSFDHEETGSVFSTENTAVTAGANFGTEISDGSLSTTSENVTTNLTDFRDPGSERD